MIYKRVFSQEQEFILDVERNAFIPFDPANTDYQQYLKWLEEGNQPEPADEMTE